MEGEGEREGISSVVSYARWKGREEGMTSVRRVSYARWKGRKEGMPSVPRVSYAKWKGRKEGKG